MTLLYGSNEIHNRFTVLDDGKREQHAPITTEVRSKTPPSRVGTPTGDEAERIPNQKAYFPLSCA